MVEDAEAVQSATMYRVTFNDARQATEVEAIAKRKGLKPAQLIRMLVLERLEEMARQAAPGAP